MVGDWVQGNPCGQHCDRNKKTYYKIAVLDIGNHCWGYSVCGAIVELKYDNIFPIPLTPEILEKNGFVGKEFYSELIVGDFRILCDVHNVCVYHNEHVDLDIPIEYLHELQHAMRICGISKEIEL